MFRRARWMACSFCGKKASDVAKLVAGPMRPLRPRPYICDACVAIAARIMNEVDMDPAKIARFDHAPVD